MDSSLTRKRELESRHGGSGRTCSSGVFCLIALIMTSCLFGLSVETCDAATDSPAVRVGSELDFLPYAFLDQSGQPAGFSVDLIRAVTASMGLDIEITTGPWDTLWNGLAAGELEILPIVAKSPERHRVADFSLPHTETFDAFFVRRGSPPIPNIEAGKGKEIVVMRADAAHHELMARKFEGHLIPVDTIPAGLSLVASGKHDAFLCSKLIGSLVIKERGIKGLTAGPPVPDYKRVFSFAVKEGNSELLEKLNQGLLIVKAGGEYERIYDKWLTADDPWLRWKKYLVPALAGLAASGVILAFWLFLLKREVKKQTQELAEKNESLLQAEKRLEERVAQRTAELEQANASLQKEVGERVKAEQSLRESEARFRLLSETAARLLKSDDPLEVVSELATEVMGHLDCHAFFNFVVADGAGKLHLNAWGGIPDEEARKIEWLDYGVAVCGCVARDGIRIVAEEICSTADPRTELVKSYGIQAYACHPLMAGERVIGTLSFGTKTRSAFSSADLDLMKTVADQVAIAMERMRLIGELRAGRVELERRVRDRTSELARLNEELKTEIQERRQIETALRCSEATLRESLSLFQQVVDGISDPIIMLDKDGLVKMLNKAALDYFGAERGEDVFGRPCFQGLREREIACPGCSYPFPSVENRPVTFERAGLNHPGQAETLTVYPILDERGQRDAIIIKITDVTQAKLLERQIFHNEKLAALGLITSGIAHEINNPNSFIHFNLPILRSYLDELMPIVDEHAAHHPEFQVFGMPYAELREDIFRLLENMAHGSERITRTIELLKSFVRKRDVEGMQQVDLKQVVDKVVALCHTELRHKVSSFEMLIPDGFPSVVSDPEALEQVLMNLLINAIHACDKPDSRVTLKVEGDPPGNGEYIIEISDNGCGIDETLRQKIFDPFFTTKSSSKGTGLGLYICHTHVTSLGGRIDFESKVGGGTIFRVVLPQAGSSPLGDDGLNWAS